MDNKEIFQDIKGDKNALSNCCEISSELSKVWNYSWIPLIIDRKTFSDLSFANKLALDVISKQYSEGHYENINHPFTKKVSDLSDPEVSVIPFRIDYLKNKDGTYVMYDLNTQPGIPGSFFWEEYWKQTDNEEFCLNEKRIEYFRIFPRLQAVFKKVAKERIKIALFQTPDPNMNDEMIKGLSNICSKISGYKYYDLDFVSKNKMLPEYSIIEPFYFIRGDISKVFTNYKLALKQDKPLGSNLKLEPYTSKDMAFARNIESYLNSNESSFLKERIAMPSTDEGVKKRLYGMSGTGYYEGNETVPWSDELVSQETLYPETCLVSKGDKINEMMYDIGITSLMLFRGRDLLEFLPVVDITVRAQDKHPISGPNTNIVPAGVMI